ncbi:uncharacterized protein F5Z01DRAFT_606227, partial [Emericellopsis atlantica]
MTRPKLLNLPQELKDGIIKNLDILDRARTRLAFPPSVLYLHSTNKPEVQHARVWCTIFQPDYWKLAEKISRRGELVVLGSDLEFLYDAKPLPKDYGPLHLY